MPNEDKSKQWGVHTPDGELHYFRNEADARRVAGWIAKDPDAVREHGKPSVVRPGQKLPKDIKNVHAAPSGNIKEGLGTRLLGALVRKLFGK